MSSILEQSAQFHKVENKIVKDRLEEITPSILLKDVKVDEVELECHVAFEIIGYKPDDLSKAIDEAWEKSDAEYLYEFIYDVWRLSDGYSIVD